jgi:Flp pilus assembly protein TadB
MTWYDSKRLIAVLLFFFGVAAIVNTVLGPYAFAVPNTLILGALLLLFGRQMYQEAELDKMDEKP